MSGHYEAVDLACFVVGWFLILARHVFASEYRFPFSMPDIYRRARNWDAGSGLLSGRHRYLVPARVVGGGGEQHAQHL